MWRWDEGWYPARGAGAQGICSSSPSPSAPQIGGTRKVPQLLVDICALSWTAAPRRSPGDLMVAEGADVVPNPPVEPVAPWQEQPLLTGGCTEASRAMCKKCC